MKSEISLPIVTKDLKNKVNRRYKSFNSLMQEGNKGLI